MNTREMAEALADALIESDDEFVIETYEDAEILTRDAGLVIVLPDGSEFQVTVVQSARPEMEWDDDEAEEEHAAAEADLAPDQLDPDAVTGVDFSGDTPRFTTEAHR